MNDLTRYAILRAIKDFDSGEPAEFFERHRVRRRAESFFIRHNGRDYDLKAIVRVARGFVLGLEDVGGHLRNSKKLKEELEGDEFGFKVVHIEAYRPANKEGRKKWQIQSSAERDPKLANAVMDRNKKEHGGWFECEACGFRDKERSMFDAHHLEPLSLGERDSGPNDLAVLCPTCHRWAHAKAGNRLYPLPVEEIRNVRLLG